MIEYDHLMILNVMGWAQCLNKGFYNHNITTSKSHSLVEARSSPCYWQWETSSWPFTGLVTIELVKVQTQHKVLNVGLVTATVAALCNWEGLEINSGHKFNNVSAGFKWNKNILTFLLFRINSACFPKSLCFLISCSKWGCTGPSSDDCHWPLSVEQKGSLKEIVNYWFC